MDFNRTAGRQYIPFVKTPPKRATGPLKYLFSPYTLVMRLSLGLGLFGGFGLGLYLLLSLAFRLPINASLPVLMQIHGQVQVLGFVALFIIAVAGRLMPSFHATALYRPEFTAIGALFLAVGVVLRALAQLAPMSSGRGAVLVLSSLLELAGALLAAYSFAMTARAARGGKIRARAIFLILTLASSVTGALLLNIAAAVELARGGMVVSQSLNEALSHWQLWGFEATAIIAVGRLLFPRFLFLRPTIDRLIGPALFFWGLGSLGVPLAWLLAPGSPVARVPGNLSQLIGGVLYVLALRLYDRPLQESGRPHITNPTRTWVRVTFGFLIAAAACNLAISVSSAFVGPITMTAGSAARHLLTQGFILPFMVFMGARLLPWYASLMVERRRLLASMIWTLFIAAAL
ncbi:MAG: hypothetical protein EXR50_06185, partial [Dehalococcoidia bacterium]|nr:hypothetical protein [Dehalococcoidia bacterium]